MRVHFFLIWTSAQILSLFREKFSSSDASSFASSLRFSSIVLMISSGSSSLAVAMHWPLSFGHWGLRCPFWPHSYHSSSPSFEGCLPVISVALWVFVVIFWIGLDDCLFVIGYPAVPFGTILWEFLSVVTRLHWSQPLYDCSKVHSDSSW